MPEQDGIPLAVLASRMLWHKGVGEFVEAALMLKASGVKARFVLVGDIDPGNPSTVSTAQLEAWQRSGSVEWWGRRIDMPEVLAKAHIVCLPSYREGMPKVLIEAAACGRPIIAADSPGCREIVRHEDNGLLVPVRDPAALAGALRCLIEDPELRGHMGTRGREIAEAEFSMENVINKILAVFRELLP
jgi:glycosyltransferase involved in cell wall biosynthesis